MSQRAGIRPHPALTHNRFPISALEACSPEGPEATVGTNPASVTGVSDHPGRLLIVDDEPAIRFALCDYFHECGWEVDAAAEKEEAEALLAHTEYAVVIADLRLTGIYGIEGLDIIQWSRHLRPETRVILLTGNGTPEIEAEARRLGADAFLYKPLPLPELERVVSRLTGWAT